MSAKIGFSGIGQQVDVDEMAADVAGGMFKQQSVAKR
jgi:hypothetical protein